jgi:hypothetical protein
MSVNTFVERMEQDFVKWFKAAPAWEQKAQSMVAYVGPFVVAIVGIADPAAAPAVGNVMKMVQGDLATISAVTHSATTSSGSSAAMTVRTAMDSIKNNLAGLLAMAEIKNSAKAGQITSVVTLITAEMDAVVPSIPAA